MLDWLSLTRLYLFALPVDPAPFTYEFKVVSQDKVLIAQPMVPSLIYYFRPVSPPGMHTRAALNRAKFD